MYFQSFFVLGLSASATASNLWPRSSSDCPSVWSTVSSDLQSDLAGCNDNARSAIRAPYHDCVNNGCDGSLILTDECSRAENAGLSSYCSYLSSKVKQYNVGAADMIEFAAATAIAICPLGPRVRALVGRKDSDVAAPVNSVPSASDPVDKILASFSAQGISASDVVALVGAHTTAKQFFNDPSKAGASLDSTPSTWDITFYKETAAGTAPYSLSSDKRMTNASQTAGTWSQFSGSAGAWAAAFTDAFNRFSVIGNDVNSLQDCSGVLPGLAKSRREGMMASIVERAFAPRALA